MLARLSPQNAASTFGASIEQALHSVESRLKRLEDQGGVASLEESHRSLEARVQRLERERDGQARTLERVETLLATRVQELKQSVNRSLEVIVEKVRGETENLRNEMGARDAELRKDFLVEIDGVRDLRKLSDGLAHLEARFLTELKATKDVCMATTVQVGAVEDSLLQVRAAVSDLPPFLWNMSIGDGPHRRPDLSERDFRMQKARAAERGRQHLVAEDVLTPQMAAAQALASIGGDAGHRSGSSAPPPTDTRRRQRDADSESTEPPSPPRRFIAGDEEHRHGNRGGLAKAALAEGIGSRSSSTEGRRKKSGDLRSSRAALVAAEALLDTTAENSVLNHDDDRSTPRRLSRNPHSMARLAAEAFTGST